MRLKYEAQHLYIKNTCLVWSTSLDIILVQPSLENKISICWNYLMLCDKKKFS